MATIVLTTLNAGYIHSAFGLRYLLANLGELRDRAAILEFTTAERPHDIAERLLTHAPRIIGFGVYIWNVRHTLDTVRLLKRIAPAVTIVVGGPEVSHEIDSQPLCSEADYVITGEADIAFAELCRTLLEGGTSPHVINAALPAPDSLELPYELYTDEDIARRVLYVEASRGCPFTCEFCLSSLDIPVRQFNLDRFMGALANLHRRGARRFKFVDRTFNLNIRTAQSILEFFLERSEPGLFVHFEMVPDRLPERLRRVIAEFPHGMLQFEVGIQSFNPEVGALISRRQDFDALADNIRFLRNSTGVHVHADLIAGLPGESLESFAAGFDRLVKLNPQEIQVGVLKRLRGTPIGRHDAEWKMVYAPDPPYELLSNRMLDFGTMQRLGRFARYWDLVANSGRFPRSKLLLWRGSPAPFLGFMQFTDWLFERTGTRHAISVRRLAELLLEYLPARGIDRAEVERALVEDLGRISPNELPRELRIRTIVPRGSAPERQQRHLLSEGPAPRVRP